MSGRPNGFAAFSDSHESPTLRHEYVYSSVYMFTHVGTRCPPSSTSMSTTQIPAFMRLRRSSHIAAASSAECAETIAPGSPSSPRETVTNAHESVSSLVTACSYSSMSDASGTSDSSASASVPSKPSSTERFARTSTHLPPHPDTISSSVRSLGMDESVVTGLTLPR